jgi:undecaprenyl diphosphate synthase
MNPSAQRVAEPAGNPRHIAIIMDGNGRWANERNLPRVEGHRVGAERIREVLRSCRELAIPYLTLYAFSKENWARPPEEVSFLMTLLGSYLDTELKEIQKNHIRFQVIGRVEELPVEVQKKIRRNIDHTRDNTGTTLTLALSYSGREEILDGVRKIVAQAMEGSLHPEEIDEKLFSESLYTKGLPDPDLLIRTSGEMRLSNFLLWQMSYSEIYVTEKYWPDFRRLDLIEAIEAYKRRERRFGRADDKRAANKRAKVPLETTQP